MDWVMQPIGEGHLLHWVQPFKCWTYQETPWQTPKISLILALHGPVKRTHKISHCNLGTLLSRHIHGILWMFLISCWHVSYMYSWFLNNAEVRAADPLTVKSLSITCLPFYLSFHIRGFNWLWYCSVHLLKKNSRVTGPVQFIPGFFSGQLYEGAKPCH